MLEVGNLKASNVATSALLLPLALVTTDIRVGSVGHPFESIKTISDESTPSTATKSRTKISYGAKGKKYEHNGGQ